jgi:hypothetical protein
MTADSEYFVATTVCEEIASGSCCETWISMSDSTLPYSSVVSPPGLEGTSLTGGEESSWSGGGRLATCPTPAPNGAQTLTVGAVAPHG